MSAAGHAPRSRPCTPTGCAPPRPPAPRAVRAGRLAAIDARRRSSRQKSIENALRVLLAIGGSTNAIIHLTAIAGRLGLHARSDSSSTRSATRRRCSSTSSRPASTTWRTSTPPAASAPCCASCRPLLHLDCRPSPARRSASGSRRAAAWVDRDVIRPLERAVPAPGRARRAVRHPRARAARSSSARPPTRSCSSTRARAVVFDSLDDLVGAHRRSRRSTSRPTTCWCCRTPGRRRAACRRPATCRSRRKLARAGRQGHGAHLRRAHERHRVRHHRAAFFARGGHRRTARTRAHRRPDPSECEGAEAGHSALGERAGRPATAAQGAAGDSRPWICEALRRVGPRRGVGL